MTMQFNHIKQHVRKFIRIMDFLTTTKEIAQYLKLNDHKQKNWIEERI